jgi:phosphomannomutase
MTRLRDKLPRSIGGRAVLSVRDIERGVEVRDGQSRPLSLPKSNVLVLELDGGARVVARPSGTEPKIKYYIDVREEVAPGEPFAEARARADRKTAELADAFVEVTRG